MDYKSSGILDYRTRKAINMFLMYLHPQYTDFSVVGNEIEARYADGAFRRISISGILNAIKVRAQQIR